MKFSVKKAKHRLALCAVACLSTLLVSTSVQAGPILADDGVVYIQKNPGVLNTTSVADPGGNPVSSIAVGDGIIQLEDYAGDALTTYSPNPTWWNAPGVAYTTTTSGIYIDFIDLNVTGFTFNIGANKRTNAWIKAYYDDGFGHELSTSWFGGINKRKTPSYGVYVAQPTQSCAVITRIEIDPQFEWGVGNFGIAQNSCLDVPAPSSLPLLGLGLILLCVRQYRSRAQKVEIES